MSSLLLSALVGGVALGVTVALTPLIRAAALRVGAVREIESGRWHKRATPAVGGVAIFAGFAGAVALGVALEPTTARGLDLGPAGGRVPWTPWEGLLAAGTVAFLLGLLDDFVRLRPLPKLLGQLAAAGLLLASGFGLRFTGVDAFDGAVSMLWFVGITNALNLLDNMDGVAGGVAAIAAAYLALGFGLEGQWDLFVVAVALSAALVGFLAHNYPPARIFMGDSGSLFIGLVLAGLALAPAPGGSRSLLAVLAAPVLILGVPILDTTVVTLGRLLEGRPISVGGRDHTTHQLVGLGMSERRTAWILWGLAALGGATGLLLRSTERGTALILGGVLVGGLTLTGAYLLSARIQGMRDTGPGDGDRGHSPSDRERSWIGAVLRWVVRGQATYPALALLLDALWMALAYYAAYLIRWDGAALPSELPYFERTVVIYVAIKVVALSLSGIYDIRWASFGLYDGLRVLRGNLFAAAAAAGAFVLLDRSGLSRGVVAIDLLVAVALTVGARLSFRLLEGTTRRLSEHGTPVLLYGDETEAPFALGVLSRLSEPRLRAVGVVSPTPGRRRARIGAIPLFAGEGALERALAETGAGGVVMARGAGEIPPAVTAHLETEGAIDLYTLDVQLRPVLRRPG